MRSTRRNPQDTEEELDGEKPGQECVITQKSRKGIRMEGNHTRGRPKGVCWVCLPGSHRNCDQRNLWKQKLEARMHRVGERDEEEMSRDSEFRLIFKEVWLKKRIDSNHHMLECGVDRGTVKGRRALSILGCQWQVVKSIERLKFGEGVGINGDRGS